MTEPRPSQLPATDGPRRVRFGIKVLLAIVGTCAAFYGAVRLTQDRGLSRTSAEAIRRLRSSSAVDRAAATSELESVERSEVPLVIPQLMTVLKDPDSEVRAQAARSLSRVLTEALIAGDDGTEIRAGLVALLEASRDRQPIVRIWAIMGMQIIADRVAYAKLEARGARPAKPPTNVDERRWVSAFLAALSDSNSEVRAAAARALGPVGSRNNSTLPTPLIAALEDEASELRIAAASALPHYKSGLEPTLPILFRLLEHDEIGVRKASDLALREIQPSVEYLPVMLGALTSPNPVVRVATIEFLTRLGPDAKAGVPALIEMLNAKGDPEPIQPPSERTIALHNERYRLTEALARIAPKTEYAGDAVSALSDQLKLDDRSAKESAASALAQFGPAAGPAIPILLEQIRLPRNSNEPAFQRSYARTLARIAPQTTSAGEVATALLELYQSESHWKRDSADPLRLAHGDSCRAVAALALGEFGAKSSGAIPTLLDELRNKSAAQTPWLHTNCIQSLGRIAPGTTYEQDTIELLVDVLGSDDRQLRYAATNALARFGPKAAKAIPKLEVLAEDRRFGSAAVASLEAIRAQTETEPLKSR
jgi:HEAT repeat protein